MYLSLNVNGDLRFDFNGDIDNAFSRKKTMIMDWSTMRVFLSAGSSFSVVT